jgi:regulatory factor X
VLPDHSIDIKPTKPRSRSNTAASGKSRKRPLSRASTTSVHSGVIHPTVDQQIVDSATEIPKQWYDHNTHMHQRFDGISHNMTPEDMLMHSASQLQNPRDYDIDPALAGSSSHHHHHHSLSYTSEVQYKPDTGRQSLPADVYANYGEGDSQMMEGTVKVKRCE